MTSIHRLLSLAAAWTALASVPLPAVETITLRSGNGPLGGPDSQIRCLAGPADNEFGTPLTPAQFAAAQTAPPAIILTQVPWINPIPADPTATWISDNIWGGWNGGTNLYAMDFNVASSPISSATLDFHFACDNWLGEAFSYVNQGLHMNGTPIGGTIGGSYAFQTSLLGLDVTTMVNPGPNTLFILSSDVGGPGGLIFSATLTLEGGSVAADEGVAGFQLGEAYPNPFNPVTTLPFELAETGPARLVVHDLAGRQLAVLFDGLAERGSHETRFDASGLASGLYLATLSTEEGSATRKLLLAK